ncbi:MAG: hypothetical protein ACOY94_16890 [Bacillota bacterium]
MADTIIGCGDFGAQVTAHLAARGMTGPGVLTWNGPATTRLAGAELARQRLRGLGGSPEGRLHLVAALSEAAGSGMISLILAELGPRHAWNLWVALPQANGDAAARARVYATLLELEGLRREGYSLSVWFREQGGDPGGTAQRFGDALLYHLRRERPDHPAGSVCRGFGVGVVREPVASLKGRLAYQVAMQVVEEYLRRPDPAHLLPGLREALQRPIRSLLVPVEVCPVYQQRWGAMSAGGESLESLLDFYELTGPWHREAWLYWDQLVRAAQSKLGAAMGYAWRSGFEVIHAEAREALALAHSVLETEIDQCEKNVLEHQAGFDEALLRAERGEIGLDELDRLVAAYLLESVRLGALERLALAIDGAVELVLDGLWAKAESVRQLLQSVKKHRPGQSAVRLAHGLTMVPSAQLEQEWLNEIQPRLARAALHDDEPPTAERILANAERDVDRYFRIRQPDLHLPRGHRLREDWLDGALPRIRLVGAERPACAGEVSPGLPGDYWEDLMTRSLAVTEQQVAWFPNEWIVYTETPPFAVADFAALPDWAEGYRAAPPAARAALHVLPEPPGGWPDPAVRPPRSEAAPGLGGF